MTGVKTRFPGAGSSAAPALEKGLDLLEALAEEPLGLSQKAIADRVGRSVGEIFRMLGVLEQRGYVLREPASGQYRLTLRLFELSHRHPPSRLLLQAASRELDRLANAIGHACHLVSLHGDRIMVAAQSQPDQQPMGWSVRVGAVFPVSSRYASARVITAFQSGERRDSLVAEMLRQDGETESVVRKQLDEISRNGFEAASSRIAQGVTDLSAPVLDHFGQALAAITITAVVRPGEDAPTHLIAPLLEASDVISRAIGGGSSAVMTDAAPKRSRRISEGQQAAVDS